MIRAFTPADLPQVMELWLQGNLDAHSFISPDYWYGKRSLAAELIPQAEVYVSEQDGSLDGFWALQTARSPASLSAPTPVLKGSEQPCSKRSCLWGSLCIFVSMRRTPPPCASIAAQASALTSGGQTRKLVNRSWS